MPKEPVVTDTLIDEIVDRVMDKVMEKMSAGFDREIVERVVSDVSERLVREEIARMLAGATITDEARAAARKLLEGA